MQTISGKKFFLLSSDLDNLDDLELPTIKGSIFVFYKLEKIKQASNVNIKNVLNRWLKMDEKIKSYFSVDSGEDLLFLVLGHDSQESNLRTGKITNENSVEPNRYIAIDFSNFLGSSEEDYITRKSEAQRILSVPNMVNILDAWQIKFLKSQFELHLSEKQKLQLQKIEYLLNEALELG